MNPSFLTLLLAVILTGVAFADESEKILETRGSTLCDHNGSEVRLRGLDLGAWLEWQGWTCPIDSYRKLPDTNPGHTRGTTVRLHVKRFGSETAEDLINSYEDAWITEGDLDNIKAL